MPKCNQFLFTAAKTEVKTGYQVIAKSEGITEEITTALDDYLYPVGVNVNEFKEARSLIKINGNKIAYSIVKNIGVGYDGRGGTLYNHTFVMDVEEFRKLGYDSRIFDEYFVEDDSIRGKLRTLEIRTKNIAPDFKLLENLDQDVLKALFHSIFRRNKIALVKTDELKLIQNLLAAIPPSMRLIEFSTIVNQPNRQYKYDFIQIPEETQSSLDRSFVIINPNDIQSLTRRRYIHEESVEKLVQLILNKDESQLNKIYKDFEKIPIRLARVRRIKKEEIFNQADFEYLAKKNNFGKFKSEVKKLYSSRKFNEASPKVIVSITKNLRKIIKKALKNQKFSREKRYSNIEQIVVIVKIMLDCMHYLHDYSEKQISIILKNEISNEIMKLESILKEYFPSETVETPYVFDYNEYLKGQFEQFVKSVQAGIAYTLWLIGFRPKSTD